VNCEVIPDRLMIVVDVHFALVAVGVWSSEELLQR